MEKNIFLFSVIPPERSGEKIPCLLTEENRPVGRVRLETGNDHASNTSVGSGLRGTAEPFPPPPLGIVAQLNIRVILHEHIYNIFNILVRVDRLPHRLEGKGLG